MAEGPDGTRLFYTLEGDGPAGEAVVLNDGIACEGFIWRYLRPALRARYRVLHWNYRGHGRSGLPRDPARIGVPDHARDLHCVLDHAGVTRAGLLAHSMGTQVCLEALRQRPGVIAGMGLLCGSYGLITRTFHGTDFLGIALPAALDFAERHPKLVRAFWSRSPVALSVQMARWLGEVDALRIDPDDLAPYFEHLLHLDPVMFFRMLHAAGVHSAEDILASVKTPVLVVAGTRDTFTPSRYAEQMGRQIPGAELLLVPEGSHTVPLEQPERVNSRVLEFLAKRVFPP